MFLCEVKENEKIIWFWFFNISTIIYLWLWKWADNKSFLKDKVYDSPNGNQDQDAVQINIFYDDYEYYPIIN
jgi:hypothetical protein